MTSDTLIIFGAAAATMTLAAAALNLSTAILNRRNANKLKKEEGPDRPSQGK